MFNIIFSNNIATSDINFIRDLKARLANNNEL